MLLRSGSRTEVGGEDGPLWRWMSFLKDCLTPNDVCLYAGEKGKKRLTSIEHHDGPVKKSYFHGEAGHERKIREDLRDGSLVYYLGKQGRERKMSMVADDGETCLYVGAPGQERLYKVTNAERSAQFYYEGRKTEERLVRKETIGFDDKGWGGGGVSHYLGAKDKEYCVRIDRVDGVVEHMVGEKPGHERVARRVTVCGKEWHYDGDRDEERVVKIVFPDNGQVQLFEGPRAKERLVETVRPNGARQFFEGERGHERKVRTTFKDSNEELHFRGPRGRENLLWARSHSMVEEFAWKPGSHYFSKDVRRRTARNAHQLLTQVHFDNGNVVYYEGDIGKERLTMISYLGNRIAEYEGPVGEERHTRTWFSVAETPTYRNRIRMLRIPLSGEAPAAAAEEVEARDCLIYSGPRGRERIIRVERQNGDVWRYEGERRREALVSITYWDGSAAYYRGPPRVEALFKRTFTNGVMMFYQGDMDVERLVQKVSADGVLEQYYGARGQEVKSSATLRDGNVAYYAGPRGEERKVMELSMTGWVAHFEGDKDQERGVGGYQSSVRFAPEAPVAARASVAGVKRKLLDALDCLEQLNSNDQCNEYVFNEMAKQLKAVHKACDE